MSHGSHSSHGSHGSHGSGSSAESMSSMMDMASSMMDMDEPFCIGDGTVMLNGFQTASEATARCVLFLFEDSAVDTKTKYIFAVIGIICMGFANEMIRYGRDRMAKTWGTGFGVDLARTFAFAVQILLAYFLMLLVMLYEYVFLIAIIVGLSAGHMVTLRLSAKRRATLAASGHKTPPEGVGSSGSPCCDNGTGDC